MADTRSEELQHRDDCRLVEGLRGGGGGGGGGGEGGRGEGRGGRGEGEE